MGDRKRMKKVREKRIEAIDNQISEHEDKIKTEITNETQNTIFFVIYF